MKKKLNKGLVFALSMSMGFTSVAAPLMPEEQSLESSLTDEPDTESEAEPLEESEAESEAETLSGEEAVESSSDSTKKDELKKDADYPEFGSNEFWEWYVSATKEEKKEWFETIVAAKDEEQESTAGIQSISLEADEEDEYPDFERSDDFMEWFYSNCVTQTEEGMELDYESVLDYISTKNFNMAMDTLDYIAEISSYQLMAYTLGELWPDTYGAAGNFENDGSGSIDDPYILDSVEDLRHLAAYVVSGQDSGSKYYKIAEGSYDLNGFWIPIGFPKNAGGNYVPFKGHISAAEGAEIINFGVGTGGVVDGALSAKIKAQESVGFFGEVGEGATIEKLVIETDNNTVEGTKYVGILAGKATEAAIMDCTVRGKAKGQQFVGGIVGYIQSTTQRADSRNALIDNCDADGVAIYSTSNNSQYGGIGGIAGYAKNTTISDVFVSTYTGSGNHIYGTSLSYSGGIVGWLKNSDIYNSFVEQGEIGEGTAYANGGIVGGYEGGQIKVARFAGTVTRPDVTNNYSAAFIGTRVNGAGFYYGEGGDIAYLFADTKTKADTGICGSRISDDYAYGYDAHIGYWHDADKYFTLLQGQNTEPGEDYFYKELERGILNIMDKGNNTDNFIINHYTCDDQGNPTRGYLLTVNEPRIDGHIAVVIKAFIDGSYKPVVEANSQGAFRAGDRIYVSFVDQAYGNVQFRPDPAKEPNPYFTWNEYFDFYMPYNDQKEAHKDGLDFDSGYWLTMPASDTVISADYKSTAKSVTLDPPKIVFEIVQERTGDRDNPDVHWYATAKDENGVEIKDANGNPWVHKELKTTPDNPEFVIGAKVNGQDNEMFNLLWQTGNTDDTKIINEAKGLDGNDADKKAKFTINITDSEMVKKANELRQAQKANNNQDTITTTSPYRYHALITGVVQGADETDSHYPAKGYCDITIKFNIQDDTKTTLDSVNVNNHSIVYDVTRTLSGDRRNPEVLYTINGNSPDAMNTVSALEATFAPEHFSRRDVYWYLTSQNVGQRTAVEAEEQNQDDGTINIKLDPRYELNEYHYGIVTLKGITSKDCTNTFISSKVGDEYTAYQREMKKVPGNEYIYKTYVKVTAHDLNNNMKTDTCDVTIKFHTVDNTTIHPEGISIDQEFEDIEYDLSYTMESDINSEIIDRQGFDLTKQLSATVSPEYDPEYTSSDYNSGLTPPYVPYDKTVVWESSDPEILEVDQEGNLTPLGYDAEHPSTWIDDIMADPEGGYVGVKVVTITARPKDNRNQILATKEITVRFHVNSLSVDDERMVFDTYLTVVSNSADHNEVWTGLDPQQIVAKTTGGQSNITYTVSESPSDCIRVATDGTVTVNEKAGWINDIIEGRADGNSGTKTTYVTVKTPDGDPLKVVTVIVKFHYIGVDTDKHEITLNVNVTQGNNTEDQVGSRKWDFTTDQLKSIVYSMAGVDGSNRNVKYEISDPSLISISEDGVVSAKTADWMLDIIKNGEHSGQRKVTVDIYSPDRATHDTCVVYINFRFDNTVMDQSAEEFDVVLTNNSRTNNKRVTWTGIMTKQLTAKVYGEDGVNVAPKWVSENPEALVVDKDGRITPVQNAKWMQDIVNSGKHAGTLVVRVNALGNNDETVDTCFVTIRFRYEDVVLSENAKTLDVTLTASGSRYSPTYTIQGNTATVTGVVNSINETEKTVVYRSLDGTLLTIDEFGNFALTLPAGVTVDKNGRLISSTKQSVGTELTKNASVFLKEAITHAWTEKNPFISTTTAVLEAANEDNRMTDQCNITINVKYIDNTYIPSSGGSSGGGGGGGGGSSSRGTQTSGSTSSTAYGLPSYVLRGGDWVQDALGHWFYSNGRTFTNEWAAVQNPYANTSIGQAEYDWFHFGADSVMTTGWYTDEFGDTYFLHDLPDGTLGHMYTGWQWIDSDGDGVAECYYFEPQSNGFRGRLYKNTVTPDGYTVNEKGQWTQNGIVITKENNVVSEPLPEYVLQHGEWATDASGKWTFSSNGRKFHNEWAAVYNPYADPTKGQSRYDWFHFGADGTMTTGWFTDADGNKFYLHNSSDGTLGHMYVGWQWIDDDGDGIAECYYFEEQSNGLRGKLYMNTKTPDGSTVNAKGQWIQNGTAVTKNIAG